MMMTIASWCDPLVGLLTPGNRRSVASSADLGGVPVRGDEGWRGLRSSPTPPQSSLQRLYSPAPRLSSSPSPLIHCQGAPPSPLVIFAPSSDGTGKGNIIMLKNVLLGVRMAYLEVFGSYWSWSPFQSLDLGKKLLSCKWCHLLVTSCYPSIEKQNIWLQHYFSVEVRDQRVLAVQQQLRRQRAIRWLSLVLVLELVGVVHILRNHFWGSRESPPLCNIVIIWAYPPLCNTVIIWPYPPPM